MPPAASQPGSPDFARRQPPGTTAALVLADGSVFWGRGVGAIGSDGADYVSDLLVEEISVAMRQLGTPDFAALRQISMRHPGALQF